MNVRTKIAVALVLSTVMVTRVFREQWVFLCWGLTIIPFVWMVALQRYTMAIKYTVIFAVVHGIRLPLFISINEFIPPILLMLFSILRNMLPGFGMAALLFMTTPISSYLNAMSRMKLPIVFNIATSVVFRFFPTIREEHNGIKSALRMRGLSGAKAILHPAQGFNYRMMPLLNCCARIGDELSMASLCRGLSTTSPRSMRTEDRLHISDILVIIASFFLLILWALTLISPNIFLGVTL